MSDSVMISPFIKRKPMGLLYLSRAFSIWFICSWAWLDAGRGYFGGLLDRIIGRLFDVLLAFPFLVAAMAMVLLLGNRVESVIIATAVINIPIFFRLIRAEVARLKNYPLVETAKCAGNSDLAILARFLVPNCLPILLVQFSVNLGWAIMNTASLSFLGLGIKAPAPEWGVSRGRSFAAS